MRRAALLTGAALAALVLTSPAAQAAVPTLGAVAAPEIGSESALLEGNLNANALPTTYSFQYTTLASFSEAGFTGAPASAPAAAGASAEALEVSATLTGLTPDTTYYYRLTATNSSGTANGNASTFTTSHGIELACEGDDCQALPPVPIDPTLTTLLSGLGNPPVRYHKLNHHKKPKAKSKKSKAKGRRAQGER